MMVVADIRIMNEELGVWLVFLLFPLLDAVFQVLGKVFLPIFIFILFDVLAYPNDTEHDCRKRHHY